MSARDDVALLVERRTEAIRHRDVDGLMSLYTDDVVSYDLVPPLVYDGARDLRAVFTTWLGGFDSAVGMELEDLRIAVDGLLGHAHWLNRTSGTLRSGAEVGYWARATICCRREGEGWLISHEHLSLPVDFTTGSASMDLRP